MPGGKEGVQLLGWRKRVQILGEREWVQVIGERVRVLGERECTGTRREKGYRY